MLADDQEPRLVEPSDLLFADMGGPLPNPGLSQAVESESTVGQVGFGDEAGALAFGPQGRSGVWWATTGLLKCRSFVLSGPGPAVVRRRPRAHFFPEGERAAAREKHNFAFNCHVGGFRQLLHRLVLAGRVPPAWLFGTPRQLHAPCVLATFGA